MSDLTLIVLSAGSSNRFEKRLKKQWIWVEDRPLWLFVTDRINSFAKFDKIVITATKREINYMRNFCNYQLIEGGDSRQESLNRALEAVDSEYVLVTDVARCCIDRAMIERVLNSKDRADSIVPTLNVVDTVVYNRNTIDRDFVKLIQTPQLSKTKLLKEALKQKTLYTDDSSAIKSIGGEIEYIDGSKYAHKLTTLEDLNYLKCLKAPSSDTFIGNGFDIHQFEENKDMYLGGVRVDSDYGFRAHSDGDVLIHSLIDSLLGAIGAGDIGELFPDSDQKFKDIDSRILLRDVIEFIYSVGFEVVNVDITVVAQKPKLSKYKDKIRESIANMLNIDKFRVNIKATTSEKLGFVGREEGVAVISSASLKLFDWTKE